MENLITWISVAFDLADKTSLNTDSLDKAFNSFKKMEKKFSEARELVGAYKYRENVSKEDIMTAQTYFSLMVTELKNRQRNLFLKTIETCTSGLKNLYKQTKEPNGDLKEIVKELYEKIKDTKLDENFALIFPNTFRKLEKTILRLNNSHNI